MLKDEVTPEDEFETFYLKVPHQSQSVRLKHTLKSFQCLQEGLKV